MRSARRPPGRRRSALSIVLGNIGAGHFNDPEFAGDVCRKRVAYTSPTEAKGLTLVRAEIVNRDLQCRRINGDVRVRMWSAVAPSEMRSAIA